MVPLLVAMAFAGCGSGHAIAPAHDKPGTPSARVAVRGAGVPAASAAVIEGWANALRSGQLQKAARYWALPSAMVNGTGPAGELALIEIRSTGDALQADATLPCGATLTATSLSGAYVKASFTLGARAGSAPQSGCSGAAAVDFLIRKGHIERWLRVATGSGPAEPAAGSTSV